MSVIRNDWVDKKQTFSKISKFNQKENATKQKDRYMSPAHLKYDKRSIRA